MSCVFFTYRILWLTSQRTWIRPYFSNRFGKLNGEISALAIVNYMSIYLEIGEIQSVGQWVWSPSWMVSYRSLFRVGHVVGGCFSARASANGSWAWGWAAPLRTNRPHILCIFPDLHLVRVCKMYQIFIHVRVFYCHFFDIIVANCVLRFEWFVWNFFFFFY